MKEKEDIRENKWDKLLKIHTMGRDDSNADQYHYPYEPTPYSVLERLANTGIIRKNNTLLDYGCGKGRVDFFLSYQTRCKSVGVEYDERIYNKAVENKKVLFLQEEYLSKRKMQNILLYQKKWTESISLIHFPWKYYKR